MSVEPTVWVSQDNGFNYAPAEQYGVVKFLTWKEIVPYAGSMVNAETITAVRKLMLDYRCGVDFLLPTGSPLAQAHMFAEAFKTRGVHRLLKWDSRAQQYFVYNISNGA